MSATVETTDMNKKMVIAGLHKNVYFNNAFKKYYHQNGGAVKRKIAYYKRTYGDRIDPSIFDADVPNEEKVQNIKAAVEVLKKKKYLQKYC